MEHVKEGSESVKGENRAQRCSECAERQSRDVVSAVVVATTRWEQVAEQQTAVARDRAGGLLQLSRRSGELQL